ncbi:MAG: lipid-A-disaccharide synthase [Proteobacteria bacterium]|nr:lipid-A-disaccharide synthase [Pseudomonadota bacterium]
MSKLLVITGEASGDLHGGNLMLELKKLRPELEIIGTGGKLMASANARLFYSVEELAVIGFSEVVKVYDRIKAIFDDLVRKLEEERPDAVLLVDYPAFNLKFAAEAKKRGIKVIYYIAPQVWAWKKNRIKKIIKFVDELIVLFPFEVEFFRREGLETHCFGHPLLDIAKPSRTREEVVEKWNLDPGKKIISFLPGSRRNEILKHLPLLFQTIDSLSKLRNDLQFVYPLASTIKKEDILPEIDGKGAHIHLVEDDTYNLVAHSDFALVASGTATLETAILQTPLIIFYKTSILTYLIGKYLLRIKAIGLPNIVADEEVVPEDPHFSSPRKMARDIQFYLENETEYARIKSNLTRVKNQLGNTGAYRKTAEFMDTLL